MASKVYIMQGFSGKDVLAMLIYYKVEDYPVRGVIFQMD